MSLESDLSHTGVQSVRECVVCGQSRTVRDDRWAELLALPSRYGVQRCAQCGLRWLSPRPDEPGLEIIYSGEHYFHSGGVTDYGQYADQRRARFAERAALLGEMGARTVLDYGAATGEFVAAARQAGLDSTGVEFSAAAREDAARKGIDLLPPDAPLGTFDAIHMNHVLEHMPDPVAHLRWCHDHLNAGGVLAIEVPQQFDNAADQLRRLTGKGGRQAEFDAFSVHHTYFFTPATLREACTLAGFHVETLRTAITPNPNIGSAKRRLLESLLAWSAAHRMTGDVIELYARKI